MFIFGYEKLNTRKQGCFLGFFKTAGIFSKINSFYEQIKKIHFVAPLKLKPPLL